MAQLRPNLIGPINTCRAVSKTMIRARSGCIVNVGSVVGEMGSPGQSVYAASKAGIVGFTRSLAKELGPRGIRANVISPGFIETEMTNRVPEVRRQALLSQIPLGRWGRYGLHSLDAAPAVVL